MIRARSKVVAPVFQSPTMQDTAVRSKMSKVVISSASSFYSEVFLIYVKILICTRKANLFLCPLIFTITIIQVDLREFANDQSQNDMRKLEKSLYVSVAILLLQMILAVQKRNRSNPHVVA